MSVVGNTGSGHPYIKFENPGDEVRGTITRIADRESQYQGKPRTWSDGSPVMESVLTIELLSKYAPNLSEGDVALLTVSQSSELAKALRTACDDASAPDIDRGGKIRVRFTAWGQNKAGARKRLFKADYKPGHDAFASNGNGNGNGSYNEPFCTPPLDDDEPPF